MLKRRNFVSAALLAPIALRGQSAKEAEDRRLKELRDKRMRGEELTAEEREYIQSVMKKRSEEYTREHRIRESTGMVPLPDLGKGEYKSEQGGLYSGGLNTPPAAHLKAGIAMAKQIRPLDGAGRPAADGKIVFISCGMSNTTMEYQTFQKVASAERGLNPRLSIVDCAQGGQDATVTADPNARYWQVAAERLAKAGVTDKQVQAVWLKQAIAQPERGYPAEAKKLQEDIIAALHNLRARYPNLKLAYLSSRIYAGYAITPLNPEPYAYEGGLSVKWAIASQINGNGTLNFDRQLGEVRSPWLAWGPYLWTDGIKARKDGFFWRREDCGPDGTHPSESGREKVARLLLQFLRTDPTAQPWFMAA